MVQTESPTSIAVSWHKKAPAYQMEKYKKLDMVNVAKIDVHLHLVDVAENVFGASRHVHIVVHAR